MTKALLDEERKFFESKHSELVKKHPGKFVLIHDHEIAGVFDTQSAAYEEGLKRFGPVPMLIARIEKEAAPRVQFPALALGLVNAS